MRILWYSLSPCGSVRRSGEQRVIQGWMISLEDEIKQNKDIDLHVAYFSDTERESFEFEGVTYHPMYMPKAKTKIGRVLKRYNSLASEDEKMLPVMLDVVKSVRPDLIHIHGTEERFGMILNYVTNIPIVFSIQGLIAPYKEKYFSGLPDKDIIKYESWIGRIRRISYRDEYKGFVYRAKREVGYLNNAKYVMGRTFWDKDITGMLNMKRKFFVVDEILRPPFYNKVWNKTAFSEDKIRIISTISGGIYKGYETVLKTALLLKQNTNIDFEWKIAGYNKNSKWVRIAENYTGIKTADVNIKLLGALDAECLSDELVASDMYVHVSHIENSPNSVCEAMLSGMPVIASFTGGTASMLENDKEGILLQDGDPYVYAGAIVDYYLHFDKARSYGEKARQRALVRHNPNRIAGQLLDAYKMILSDKK